MVKEYEHLKVEDHGHVVICVLSNPPSHTFTSKSLMEVHDFLDQMDEFILYEADGFTTDVNYFVDNEANFTFWLIKFL